MKFTMKISIINSFDDQLESMIFLIYCLSSVLLLKREAFPFELIGEILKTTLFS